MARFRRSLRRAGRHTGEQFDSGYQYRHPQRDEIILGGWTKVWPFGLRDVPADVLTRVDDGVLMDGVVYPIWHRTNLSSTVGTVVGVAEHNTLDARYQVVFIRTDLDKLLIRVMGATGVWEYDPDITTTTERVVSAVWGKTVYFSLGDGGELYKIILDTGVVSSVADTVAGLFIFILSNHLFVISESDGAYYAHWSVNGSPENWTGSGSGSIPLSTRIGRVQGAAHMSEYMMVLGDRGAMRIIPTGTLPPFRFQDVAHIRGAAYLDAVAGLHGLIYYIDHARRLLVFDGNRASRVGEGEAAFDSPPVLYGSRRVGHLLVSTEEVTLLLDTTTQQWVGTVDDRWEYLADAPSAGQAGRLMGYTNTAEGHTETTFALDAELLTYPRVHGGRHRLPREALIETVELIRTAEDAPTPILTLVRQLMTGVIERDYFFDEDLIEDQKTSLRFRINSPAEIFEVQFGVDLEGSFQPAGDNFSAVFPSQHGFWRATLEESGNYSVTDTSVLHIISAISEGGNFVMRDVEELIQEMLWRRDVGIERVVLTVQSFANGPAISA